MFFQRIQHFVRTKRFFLTLLLYFLSFLTPLIVMSFVSYIGVAQMIREDFDRKIKENLSNSADDIDGFLISSNAVAVGFLADGLVKQYFIPDAQATLEQKAERWRIPRILEQYQNITSNFIDSIFAYYPEDTLVYTSTGTLSPQLFFDTVFRYESYDLEFWQNLQASASQLRALEVDWVNNASGNDSRLVLPWVRVSKLNGQTAVVVINISVEQIVKTLEGGSVAEGTRYLIVGENGNTIWNGTGLAQDTPQWDVMWQMLEHQDHEPGMLNYVWLDDQRFLACKVVTSQFNWQIYSLVPLEAMSGIASVIPRVLLWTCLILMLVIVALSLLFSKRIYRPITLMVDAVQHQSGGVLEPEGKDEMELLRTGVDKLMESQMQYKQRLDQYSAEYLEYAFRLMISGSTPVNQQMLSQILEGQLSFHDPNYIVCCVCFRFHSNYYRDHTDLERINIAEKLRNILAYLLGDRMGCYVMEPRQNIYVCLINCQEQSQLLPDNQVFSRMKSLFSYDRRYFDVAVGIGGISYGVAGIRDSYHQAMAAVQGGNDQQFFQVHLYRNTMQHNLLQFTMEDQLRLVNALKAGNRFQLLSMVEELLERNTRLGISYEEYHYLYHQLIMLGAAYLSERGKSLSDLGQETFARSVIAEMKIPEDPMVGKQLLLDFYSDILESCSSPFPQKSESLVQTTQDFVQHNYASNLGLEQIADQMGVSVKYISRVFKQRTGKNLTDFIGEIRIQKAKELLTQTDQKVGDIAAAVGIENRTTFLRVFKKYEGISPIEYRNLHQHDKTNGAEP